MKRAGLAIVAGAMALALLPAHASATNCTHIGGVVTVGVTAGDDQISLERSGNEIKIFIGPPTAGPGIPCTTTPTVTNTETIAVNDGGAHDLLTLVSLQGGPLEPGITAEASGVSEIEVTFNGFDGNDRLHLDGTDNAERFRFGQTAPGALMANLNLDREPSGQDFNDVATTAVEELLANGRRGKDELDASGNSATGLDAADPAKLTFQGGNQEDTLRGGPGADDLQGGSEGDAAFGVAGDDTMDGGIDNDQLDGGPGADRMEGGDGEDRALYEGRATPVAVSVGNGVADDGGAEDISGGSRDNVGATVEEVTGGAGDDFLAGSALINRISGGGGNDTISGLGANDTLDGDAGDDTEDGGPGADLIRGQSGKDVMRGGGGRDKLLGGDSADSLFGGAGGDQLRGQKGKDSFKGQGGADKLGARDGRRDKRINCGKGRARKETAAADRVDPRPRSC